jgi:hypothetical protein
MALAPPSASARRTGSVLLAAKLIAGHDTEGERGEPGQDGPDAAGVLDLGPGPEMGTSPGSSTGPNLAGGPTRERRSGAGRRGPGRQGAGGCGCPERPRPYSGVTLSDEEGSRRTRAVPPFCTGTIPSVRSIGDAQNGPIWVATQIGL